MRGSARCPRFACSRRLGPGVRDVSRFVSACKVPALLGIEVVAAPFGRSPRSRRLGRRRRLPARRRRGAVVDRGSLDGCPPASAATCCWIAASWAASSSSPRAPRLRRVGCSSREPVDTVLGQPRVEPARQGLESRRLLEELSERDPRAERDPIAAVACVMKRESKPSSRKLARGSSSLRRQAAELAENSSSSRPGSRAAITRRLRRSRLRLARHDSLRRSRPLDGTADRC